MRAYACRDERRRTRLQEDAVLAGIDFLEVSGNQRELHVHFVPAAEGVGKTVVPPGIGARNVEISGGTRITRIRAGDPVYPEGEEKIVVPVTDDRPEAGVGDFSPYVLRLVDVENLDPVFSEVAFSFKDGCPSEFDCRTEQDRTFGPPREPELDYLARDYASFRGLLLDRLSAIMPGWQERNPADLQVALVELLAYAGDHLSYQQDAVATEAYLGTARRRTSVRRHARLVDYFVHDGRNARAWVQVTVNRTELSLPAGTPLLTRTGAPPGRIHPDLMEEAVDAGAEAFETMHPATLRAGYDELPFYTWGDGECCLPAGATAATLRGTFDRLATGDVLVFEEVLGPRTGNPADADPGHRHPARLTEVSSGKDGQPLTDPLYGESITEIRWHQEDALPFPLCLSARVGNRDVEDVSVARGNIVLADHGLTVEDEPLGAGPDEDPIPRVAARPGVPPGPVFPRFRPALRRGPLTQAAPYAGGPAAAAMGLDAPGALPRIRLREAGSLEPWLPARDLLGSGPSDRRFVAEVEQDGRAYLRFGDDAFGLRPARGARFSATYRVGNGADGNVGAGAIAHVVSAEPGIAGARNPIPAGGGVEPETIEEVRQRAPSAFRVQQRAVTPEDYAAVAQRHPQVQRAAATIRWTGSWHTVFLTIDRLGGLPVDEDFETELRAHLEGYRLAGHDLEVDGPRYASLEVGLFVCALPGYFRSDVKAALLAALGNRNLPGGRRGFFHPDNFTFGQPVYLGRLYEAAQGVDGVDRVEVRAFRRQGALDRGGLDGGELTMQRLEVARLDNDPNFPENGVLDLVVEGGS